MPKKGEGKYMVNSMTKPQKVQLILWINNNRELLEKTSLVESAKTAQCTLGFTIAPYTLRGYVKDIFPNLKFPKPVYEKVTVRAEKVEEVPEKRKPGQWIQLLYNLKTRIEELEKFKNDLCS